MIKHVVYCIAFTLLGVLGAGTTALAQDVEEKQTVGVLEEVTVSAQKRAENIQDVPISITAFTGDFLEETGIRTVGDVSRITPNFTISTSSQLTNQRITIRGIGSVGNNAIEPSVGVFIDGVYYPRPGSVIGQLLDIETFEVLRGPQGTLFGRNTAAGALNITTRNPSQEKEGMFEFSYGDYDAMELGAVVSGGLSESVSGRFAIKYADRDGYGFNTWTDTDFGERDDLVMRGKLNFDFGDKLSLLVTADYAKINATGSAQELLNSTASPVFDGTVNALYGDTVTTDDPYDWVVNQDHQDGMQDEQWGLSADLNYGFDNGLSLRSITAYREWESLINNESVLRIPTNMIPRDTDYQTDTISQEFQLLSPGGETIDWIAGLFYYEEQYDILQTFSAGDSFCVPTVAALVGPPAAGVCLSFPLDNFVKTDFYQKLDSTALFGQGTWNINDSWALTLGLRWSDDKKTGDFIQSVTNPFATLIRVPETVLDMKQSDSKTTYFGNLKWFVSDDVMLFGTYSTGYKSGGFNSEGAASVLGRERRIFAPEETSNYELGIKSTLLDSRMTANVTAFRMDLDDFQNRSFDGLSFIVQNAGAARLQGIEADINWIPVDPLRIVAGIGYLDSEYTSFKTAPPMPGNTEPQDLSGARLNYTPEWQLSLDADWTGNFRGGMEWFTGVGWQFIDDQNVSGITNNNPQTIQEAYSLIRARLGLRAASGKWDLTLFGNNVTDEGYCSSMFPQPFGAQLGAVNATRNTSVQRCTVGTPRTWNIKFRWWF